MIRRISRRFIAGESTTEAIELARRLGANGIRSTMDILGEHVESHAPAQAYTRLYLELIERQAAADVDRNVSVKLSQLGLTIDRDFCLANLRALAELAAESGGKVRIDMEDSGWTDDTLWVYRRLRADQTNVGIVLQAYLHRTLGDVEELLPLRPDYRLCKGIYVETPERAIQDAEKIRENFLAVLEAMWDGGSFVGIATHDQRLVDLILERIARRGLGPERYEFQMLLGVQERLRDRLVGAGHPLRIYLPFGRDWYAYSLRRLQENPSVAGHVFRSLLHLG